MDGAEPATSDAALVMGFESCGDNCEFGLLQKAVGHERLGLFRYAGVADVDLLSGLIASGFDGLGAPGSLRAEPGESGWMIWAEPQRLVFHSGRQPSETSRKAVLEEAARLLRFAADKFLEDVREASKIFVFRTSREKSREAAMLRLHDALGGARLLWVVDGGSPGVSVVRAGLALGVIEKFLAEGDDYGAQAKRWLALLRESCGALPQASPNAAFGSP